MKKKHWKIIRFLIGITILFILFKMVGFNDVFSSLTKINIGLLPLFYLLFVINYVLAAYNFSLLLKPFKFKIGFLKILKHHLTAWSFGAFSPGKVGEFSIVYFLNKEGLDFSKVAVVSLLDRMITVATLGVVAIIGALYFLNLNYALLIFSCLVLAGFFTLLVIKKERLIRKYILKKYSAKFEGFSNTFFEFIEKRKLLILKRSLFNIIKLGVVALCIKVLFLSLGQDVKVIHIMLIASITIMSSLIPISISGLGVKQSMGLFLYSLIGVSYGAIMSNYAIFIFSNYTLAACFSLSYLFRKKRMGQDG